MTIFIDPSFTQDEKNAIEAAINNLASTSTEASLYVNTDKWYDRE